MDMANRYAAMLLTPLVILAALLVIATPGDASVADQMKDRLLTATSQDDAAAYRRLRDEALTLPDEQFAALLDALGKIDSWQAMAMREGIKLRREQPKLAGEFDGFLERFAGNPHVGVAGNIWYTSFSSLRPGIDSEIIQDLRQIGPLQFEAVLAVEGVEDPDSLRRSLVLGLQGKDSATIGKFVALLKDKPEWIEIRILCREVGRSHHIGAVDPYMPDIVEQYRLLRGEPDGMAMGSARLLMLAISRASADVALPALRQIEQFERLKMAEQNLKPWDQDMEALRASHAADYSRLQQISRESRQIQDEDVARELEQERQMLRERMAQTAVSMAATHLWDDLQNALSALASRAVDDDN